MTKENVYQVQRNRCQCHPETCCCNDWAVLAPNGTTKTTCFHQKDASDIAVALNKTIDSQEV